MDSESFSKNRINNIINCNQPLIAIASVMRSGGNLLNRFFDGHSQLRTYHSEMLFGVLNDLTLTKGHVLKIQHFPLIDSHYGSEDIFNQLSKNDPYIKEMGKSGGWVKVNYNNPRPFFYDAQLHKNIFMQICRNTDSTRDILDKYITSYFNSYIDYQGLYSDDKLFTTTYWPDFIMDDINIERFFMSYPTGFIISIIRNPLQWAGSAKKRRPKEFNYDYMDSLWKKSADSSINWSCNNNVILIDFDDLINNTNYIMNKLCKLIGIKYSDTLCNPTFNSMSIEGNSINRENQKTNIVKTVLHSYNEVLNDSEIKEISERYLPLFNSAKKL